MEQVTKSDIKEVLLKLAKIQNDMEYLKKHVKNEDIFLSEEEEKLLQDSYKNEKEGKLISHSQLKKELGI
ncbi:MAG: hypothetical protein AABY10_06315 [Nanoarchaeota archaeon]